MRSREAVVEKPQSDELTREGSTAGPGQLVATAEKESGVTTTSSDKFISKPGRSGSSSVSPPLAVLQLPILKHNIL